MSHQPIKAEFFDPSILMLKLQSLDLTDEQFEHLCLDNPDLRIELTSRGELIVMPPTGLKTGWRNTILSGDSLSGLRKMARACHSILPHSIRSLTVRGGRLMLHGFGERELKA